MEGKVVRTGSYRLHAAKVALALSLGAAAAGCTSFDVEGYRYLVGVNGDRTGSDLEAVLEKAASHYREGHFGLAVNTYQSALGHDPKSVRALNGAAASYDRLGRFDLAHRNYMRALAADSGSAMTLNNLGYSMLLQERPAEALEYFERARAVEPDNTTVDANIELAEKEVDRLERQSDLAKAPVDLVEESQTPPRMWIERTNERTLTLVTKPDARVLDMAADTGLHPKWFSLEGRFSGEAAARAVSAPAEAEGEASEPNDLIAAADFALTPSP